VSEATKLDPKTGLPLQEGQVIDENGEQQTDVKTDPPAVDAAAIQKELDDLKIKNKELEDKVDTLEKDNATLVENNKKAVEDLKSSQVLLDQAQKSLKTVEGTLAVKESELATEKTLRETAENQVIELNTNAKNSLVENVLFLRKSLGMNEIAKEDLEKRSTESLNDAVKDLKEEIDKPLDVTKITPAHNPGLVENQDPNPNDVKEKKNKGNIDLVEGLENVFSTIIGAKSSI
jgi:chromosome segregation ATPase